MASIVLGGWARSAVAGDLFVDGAIGSRTASLCSPYLDAPHTSGAAYLDAAQIAAHVEAATRAGMQAGFHVIGDAASDAVLDGFTAAARALGTDAVRARGHRLEHAELLSDDHIATMADLGILASMQPMFDGLWGGHGGMYEQRLGVGRAAGMNRIADLLRAGVETAFGSDAPVTSLGPWEAMRAAIHHSLPAQRIDAPSAFSAHSVAGWRAAGIRDAGRLTSGSPAHYAVWDVDQFGSDHLPVLDPDGQLPDCVRTVVSGCVVFDRGVLN